MAKKRIVKYGEDILREKMKPVNFEEIKDSLPQILADMEETCLDVQGLGLSANQIGLPLRLAIIIMPEEEEGGPREKIVIINPEFIQKKGKMCEEEGCLSLPGLYVEIERAAQVSVKALDENGKERIIEAKGLLAKALQHEIDHLDGKIFIDYADPKLKPEIKKALKTLSKKWN
ncbi:peptide deformylase [Parelusimicrobium proximum]|uniref:peptide deformylase n=1 Tax=Parelusimicrobium proximum TaxID=3228953 RepID=UPI003D17B781